jgi:Fe2+ or Zn2+ uptake regulation protein
MENIFLPMRRIALLQGLEREAGRELSNEMLQRCLKAIGQHCSLAEVNEQINWLEARGYVKNERLASSALVLVKITQPGIDVALGNTRADGIDPPPED